MLYSKNLKRQVEGEGSSLSKTFFFAFAKKQEIFRDLHVCRKKACFRYYAHVKRLHSVKWRGFYGDTATMQELLLKSVQVLHGGKEVWNETVTGSYM